MFKMTKYVTNESPIMTGAMSAYPFSEGLQARYTFKTTYDDEICGAIRVGDSLWVPRESVPYAVGSQDFRISYPPSAIDCTVKFRPGQEELCNQSLDLLNKGISHIFQASTGFGKTVCGSYIAAKLGQPTLIIVTKDDLMQQWKDSLINILKIPAKLIGHIQADVCEWKDKMFVLGMVQSLIIPDRYEPEMYKHFGLMILDEVHSMAADCFIRCCQMVPAKYRLGFSATPDRKDGKTRLLNWHVGPVMVRGGVVPMKPRVLLKQTGWKIPCHRKLVGNSWEYIPIPHSPARMMSVYKAMSSSNARNLIITEFVVQAYHAGRRVLVLSDLREAHLNRLFQIFTGEGIPGNDIGYYVGQMSKFDLGLSKKAKVILGTYKMCSTGTDVPAWDTLVLATPKADVKQPMGRILRSLDGKKEPVILDLVDYDALLQGFSLSRLKNYYEIGAAVFKM